MTHTSGLAVVSIRKRLEDLKESGVKLTPRRRSNPCGNCGGRWPVYRLRGEGLYSLRTFCSCGWAQYPYLLRWRLYHWITGLPGWLRFCREYRWVSPWRYLR